MDFHVLNSKHGYIISSISPIETPSITLHCNLGCPRSVMFIIGQHWINIACIGNLILVIKSVIHVEINVSMLERGVPMMPRDSLVRLTVVV